ncbi:MAG: pyrroline-5-carboxylate reductase [Chloroflexota bacterium]
MAAQMTIATIGTGVMAGSMLAGLFAGGRVRPEQVIASDPRAERRAELEAELGIRTTAENAAAASGADVVVLAIKPQHLAEVGRDLAPVLGPEQLVISILAGPTTRALGAALGHRAIVRAMPNTPAQIGRGITVWYATPDVRPAQRETAALLLGALGEQVEVHDEKLVAMSTAVSGSGPAYLFLVMEAMVDAAVHLGFPRHVAQRLVVETLEGSAAFAKASGHHPAQLRDRVTSPGGTTAAALHALEAGRLRTVLSDAIWAAYRRTDELGRKLEAETTGDDTPAGR